MAQQDDNATDAPGFAAFESRDDLTVYGDNALLLFVAQLRLGLDDVDSFASNSLTDGSNDKTVRRPGPVRHACRGDRVIAPDGLLT